MAGFSLMQKNVGLLSFESTKLIDSGEWAVERTETGIWLTIMKSKLTKMDQDKGFDQRNQRKWGLNEQIEGLHTKTLGSFASLGGF